MNKGTILCAIDKSKSSVCALQFALNWAKKYDSKVEVVHVLEDEMRMKAEFKQAKRNEIIEFLKANNLPTEVKFIEGIIVESINSICPKYSLIVMGIRGANHSSKFYGSTAAQIIHTVRIPVFLIPERDVDIAFKKIGFASDFKDLKQHERFEFLRELVLNNDSELHLLHVSTSDDELEEPQAAEAGNLHKIFNDVNHGFFLIKNMDVVEGIKAHIKENSIDLLAIMPRKTTTLANTMSQAIVNSNYKLPIFSFHA